MNKKELLLKKTFDNNIQKNKNLQIFLENISNYTGETIYVYGSILRSDYNKKSDVDICIFTHNINSLKIKLQHFLVTNKKNFKTIYWILPESKRMAVGYKIFYKNIKNNLMVEISIYNEKYKNEILNEHYSKTILPYYATILLFIIKFLHYDMNILNRTNYAYLKKIILSTGIGKKKDDFIVI
jgi:predicted nucleotidyltransferase